MERRLTGDPRTGQHPGEGGIHKLHAFLVKQDIFYLNQNKLIIEFMKRGAGERVHTNSGTGEPAYVSGTTPAPSEEKWERIVLFAPIQP